MKLLENADVKGRRVIVRVDFNVPVDEKGRVAEDERIAAAMPTIRYLVGKGCRVVLMSHLGRPKGKVVENLRMNDVARRASGMLGVEVKKLDDCIGKSVEEAVSEMRAGDVVLLENLRFHPEEEANGREFAKKLSALADVYVNDAFGASHRTHASVVAITEFLPGYAGFLLDSEIGDLRKLLESPERPFVAVIGGAKVSDKVKLISSLLGRVDTLLIGGAMAFTFIKGHGHEIGDSKVEEDFVEEAHDLMKTGKIKLPVDVVVADKFDNAAKRKVVPSDRIDSGWAGLDIGPETVKAFKGELNKARSVVWNGPMGVFEFANFKKGTDELARHIASLDAMTVIGGGDTLAAAKKAGVYGKFSHTSTGGGAMLEFLEGRKLPAIEALEKSK